MERKARELKRGLRLNLRKPPKAEVPKNIYTRKDKHKKGRGDENRDLFLCHAETASGPSLFIFAPLLFA